MLRSVALAPATIIGLGLFIFTAVLVWIFGLYGVPSSVLVRDPAHEFGFPYYAGLISYVGIAALVTSAAITGFASSIGARHRDLLRLVSIFSGLLAMDDLLTLHESIIPQYLGISENHVYAGYALLFLIIAWRIWNRRQDFALAGLCVALGFLGASVVVDVLEIGAHAAYWFEDALKLAGIGAWTAYWSQMSAQMTTAATKP